jgi:hypothetical protein
MPSMDPANTRTMNWYLVLARRVLVLNPTQSLTKRVQALQAPVLQVLSQAACQPLKNSPLKILGRRQAVTSLPVELFISCKFYVYAKVLCGICVGESKFLYLPRSIYSTMLRAWFGVWQLVVLGGFLHIVDSILGYQDNAHLLAPFVPAAWMMMMMGFLFLSSLFVNWVYSLFERHSASFLVLTTCCSALLVFGIWCWHHNIYGLFGRTRTGFSFSCGFRWNPTK